MRLLLAVLLLAACAGDGSGPTWEAGPEIRGINYSDGIPRGTPGDEFTFPACPLSVNYVTKAHSAPLTGSMSLTYTITGDATLAPEGEEPPARVTLYFQREGDDWQAGPETAFYRWYSRTRPVLEPGTHTLTVALERDKWGPVLNNIPEPPTAFSEALSAPQRVGFVFGGRGGAGHGVCARDGESRFVLERFEVRE